MENTHLVDALRLPPATTSELGTTNEKKQQIPDVEPAVLQLYYRTCVQVTKTNNFLLLTQFKVWSDTI